MNWDRIEGNWKQAKGNIKKQWGKLTNDQLDVINGRRDILAGKLQEAYGYSKDEAENQIRSWEARQTDDDDEDVLDSDVTARMDRDRKRDIDR